MVVDCNRQESEEVKEVDLPLYAALNCFPANFRDYSEDGTATHILRR